MKKTKIKQKKLKNYKRKLLILMKINKNKSKKWLIKNRDWLKSMQKKKLCKIIITSSSLKLMHSKKKIQA